MEEFTGALKKDLVILIGFTRQYCRAKHDGKLKALAGVTGIPGSEALLCRECAEMVEYAMERRRKCPLDPKPSCRKCRIHCYGRDKREKIRKIMAFAGRRMILRGRIDYLWHYLS